jgi:hypothetical protein
MILADGERVDSVSSFQNGVSAKPEKLSGCPAQRLFILHQQHGLGAT